MSDKGEGRERSRGKDRGERVRVRGERVELAEEVVGVWEEAGGREKGWSTTQHTAHL